MLSMMSYDIIFNKELEKSTDWISPGGFEIKINEENIGFDFERYYGYIDKTNPKILHIEHHFLDINCFPDAVKINSQNLLGGIFTEFYIDYDREKLSPVSISNLEFEFEEDSITIIATPNLEKSATEVLTE